MSLGARHDPRGMQDILKDKVAVVFGAGFTGGAVARAFAREGAAVFIANHHLAKAEQLAAAIRAAGGRAEAAEVDALDPKSLAAFVADVVARAGRIDIAYNAINIPRGGEQGTLVTDLAYEDFAIPMTTYLKAQYLTAKAVAPQLIAQGGGVIMTMTALASRTPIPGTAGFGPAWSAVEALMRLLAVELGPHGVRTVCLNSTGSPESQESIARTISRAPGVEQAFTEAFQRRAQVIAMVPRMTSLDQVGDMAAFMASDRASTVTGTLANMTSGMVLY